VLLIQRFFIGQRLPLFWLGVGVVIELDSNSLTVHISHKCSVGDPPFTNNKPPVNDGRGFVIHLHEALA
jgi:hypothetical protein